MKTLHILATPKTPEVFFDQKKGIFEIKGKSIPDDAESFYHSLLDWFDEYLIHPNNETVVTIDLEYFNISSSKRLLFLMYKLNELCKNKCTVRVRWLYNESDEDMFELGQDYALMVKVPFDFISYSLDEVTLAG